MARSAFSARLAEILTTREPHTSAREQAMTIARRPGGIRADEARRLSAGGILARVDDRRHRAQFRGQRRRALLPRAGFGDTALSTT
jgi:hypothetical protein